MSAVRQSGDRDRSTDALSHERRKSEAPPSARGLRRSPHERARFQPSPAEPRRRGHGYPGHQFFARFFEMALRCQGESSGSAEQVRTSVTNDRDAPPALPVTR